MHRRIFVLFASIGLLFSALHLAAQDGVPQMTAAAKGGKPGGGGSGGSATYGGRAVVLDATVLGIRTLLSEAGPLGSAGGAAEASLLSANVLGLIQAEVLHAATIGQADRTRSEASVASLNLTVANLVTISAGLIEARAMATCAGTSGSSDLVALTINGQSIRVTGHPNQQVNLVVAQIIINEQIVSAGKITVNALHVIVPGIADVVVSSAEAGITCSGTPGCQGGDFITGGGFVTGTPTGAKGTFGAAGGLKHDGSLWGHLTYIDHGTGLKVKGTGITGYTIVNSVTRVIHGTADANGQAVTFTLTLADNGEPGTNDTFHLQLSSGYNANGPLQGGNIQLHQPCH